MRSFSRWTCISMALLSLYVGGTIYILSPPSAPTVSGLPPQYKPVVDSIVFIALGPASRSHSLLYALQSLREIGQWNGPVHVIVEHEHDLDCISSYLGDPRVQTIVAFKVPPRTNDKPGNGGYGRVGDGASGVSNHDGSVRGGSGAIAQAKMAKMQLLDLLPSDMRRVLYIDCDIITQRPLGPFLEVVKREWAKLDWEMGRAAGTTLSTPHASPLRRIRRDGETIKKPGIISGLPSTLLIFPDTAGHTMPLCSGCDRAHSGVVAIERGRSERCLQLWMEAFAGDAETGTAGTATDQEALDLALRKGSGCEARWLDSRHMRFMKDIFVVLGWVRERTFAHFTGLLHPERLGKMHLNHYQAALGKDVREWGYNGGIVLGCDDERISPPHR